MKKFTFLFSLLALLFSFSLPTFAATEVFSSTDGTTQVFFDENGNLQYKTPELNSLQTIEASIEGDGLIDVSADGKWVAFQKGVNIFLLNLQNNEIHQISLNLDSHWSWFNLKLAFSPDSQHLANEIEADGMGGTEVCIYDVNNIDFQGIESQIEQYNQSDGLTHLIQQCWPLSSKIDNLIQNGEILPVVDEGGVFDVYGASWDENNFLMFSTSLFQEEEKWKMSEDGNQIQQIEGKSLTTPPFSDMTMGDSDMQEVLRAMQEGWIKGDDGTNTIRLDDPINRAEFSKVAILALGIEGQEPPQDQPICPDVSSDQWYSGVFYTAKQLGAIEGYPQEGVPKEQWLCKPDQTINKVEALKVALELNRWDQRNESVTTGEPQYNDTTDSSQWYWLYTGVSRAYNLIRSADGNLYPGQSITRREVIYLINHMRDEQSAWLGVG